MRLAPGGDRIDSHLEPARTGPEVGHAGAAGLCGGGAKRAGEVMNLWVRLRGLPVVLEREPVRQPTAKRPL
jgi:hypothetical protein